MYKINFIANAIGDKYERFLIPFTFFALLTNDNSHVEIIVVNSKKFKEKYKKELLELNKINKNYLIINIQFKINKHIKNTYRFFEIPKIKAKYTYIVDVDIMFMENVLDKYETNWPDKLIYNNIIRYENVDRLTGVHMVITDKYYKKKFIFCQKKYYLKNYNENDEVVLCKMCKEIHGLPDFNHRYRPILGIHFSPNRGPKKKMNLRTYKPYYDIFYSLKDKYPKMFAFEIFMDLTNSLENDFIIK